MKTRQVVVLPYDAKWKSDFDKIKAELEQRLLDEYSVHPVYLDQAWDLACQQLENMFSAVTANRLLSGGCELQIVPLAE